MSLPQCKMTSIAVGVCFGHFVPIPTCGMVLGGSTNVRAEGLPAARMVDNVMSFCGHIGIIITGSSTVRINGLPAARMTDRVAGVFNGVLVTGCPTVRTG